MIEKCEVRKILNSITDKNERDKIIGIFNNNQNLFTNYDNIKKIVSDQNLVKNAKDIYANYIKNIGNNIRRRNQSTFDVDFKPPSKVDIESARERLKKAEQNNNGSHVALKELENASARFTHLNNERLNHRTMDKEKKNFISNLYNVYGARSGTGSYNISDMKERQKEMIGTIAELLDEHARQCMAPPGGDCKYCPNLCPDPDAPPICDTLFQTRNIEPKNSRFRKMALASIICFLIAYILVKIVNNIEGTMGFPKHITIFDRRRAGGVGNGSAPMKLLRDDTGIFNIQGAKNQNYQLNTLFPFITNKFLLRHPFPRGSLQGKFCNPGILIYAVLFGLYSGYMVKDIKNNSDNPTEKNEKSAQKGLKWFFTVIIAVVVSGLLYYNLVGMHLPDNLIRIGQTLGSILAGVVSGVIVYYLAQSMSNVKNDKQCGSMKYVLTGCYLTFSIIYLLSLKLNNYDGMSRNILPILRNVFLIALFAMHHSFNAILIKYFPGIWVSWMIIQKVILSLFTNLNKFIGLGPNLNQTHSAVEYRASLITRVLGSMGALPSNGGNFQFLLDPLLYGIANGFGIDFFLNPYQDVVNLNPHLGGWIQQFQIAMFSQDGTPAGLDPMGVPVQIPVNIVAEGPIGFAARNINYELINPIQPIPSELIGTDFVI